MFCRACGAKLVEDSRFCVFCGTEATSKPNTSNTLPATNPWPSAIAQEPSLSVPFKTVYFVSKGSVPDFREGVIEIAENGLRISGKATIPYEVRAIIYLLLGLALFLHVAFQNTKESLIFVTCTLYILAWALIEFLRKTKSIVIPWSDVQGCVVLSSKRQICIVYSHRNFLKKVKKFSLTFNLPDRFDTFLNALHAKIPGRVQEGTLQQWHSPIGVTVFATCVGLVIAGLIFAIYNMH